MHMHMYQLVCVVHHIYLEYAYVAINTMHTTTTTTTTTTTNMHTTTTSQLAKSTDWYASYQVWQYTHTVPIILLLLYIMNIMHNITLALVFEYNIIYDTTSSQYYYYQSSRSIIIYYTSRIMHNMHTRIMHELLRAQYVIIIIIIVLRWVALYAYCMHTAVWIYIYIYI